MPEVGVVYNNALLMIVQQDLDLATDELMLLLVDDSYTFDPTHEDLTDITGELVNDEGTGYERKDITGASIDLVSGNKVRFDCNDVEYSGIDTTEDIQAGIIALKGATDADRKLVAYMKGKKTATNGSDIDFRIPSDGVAEFLAVQPE